MRKIPLLLIGATLAASPLAMAGPVVLTDQQLERVSAGSTNYEHGNTVTGSGGAIVGNYSSANLTTSGDVSLKDGAQQGARAVNLVNSAESGMANGVNVWDGRINEAGAATVLDVTQANTVTQDQSRTASLQTYARTDANTTRDYSEWSKTTHKGKVDTRQEISGGDLPSVDVQVGKGISIAGEADLHIDAGNLNISNHVVLGSTHTVTNVEIAGAAVKNTNDIVLASADQNFDWTLPEVSFAAKAAGCWVVMGMCDADGTYETSITDNTVTHAPFSLDNAQAEYIVLDGSTLDTNTSYSVALAGSAQSNARAVNLANAAGSVVANAVNVSRTPTVGPNLNLSQVNTIVQRR